MGEDLRYAVNLEPFITAFLGYLLVVVLLELVVVWAHRAGTDGGPDAE